MRLPYVPAGLLAHQPRNGDALGRLLRFFRVPWTRITRQWSDEDYLHRFYLLGGSKSSSRFLPGGRALYLHRFVRSDLDEMHDHPWAFWVYVLSGGYYEHTPGPGWHQGSGLEAVTWMAPGTLAYRPANWIHRVAIPAGRESWSLILRGEKEKSWGFFCAAGANRGKPPAFVNWQEHHRKSRARPDHDGCGG